MSKALYIGLISGTSMDGFDCALIAIEEPGIELLDYISPSIEPAFREKLLSVCKREKVSLVSVGELDHLVARHFTDTVFSILERNKLAAKDISAIGSHGQTIWHQPPRPDLPDQIPFTMQIGDPNLITHLTGITTVADFRRRDMAAGGQAAPLVPAFHARVFANSEHDSVVLNIGGMSNITRLAAGNRLPVIAYDTGPGNVLLDAWIERHHHKAYDNKGEWAASGNVDGELLNLFMQEPYLALPAPKSTGRELFNQEWTDQQLAKTGREIRAQDVQATLLEFTVRSIAGAVGNEFEEGEVLVCGGGSRNPVMLARLQQALPAFSVMTTSERGINPEAMEAAAFAWFASQTLRQQPVDLCSITGAARPVILGGIYHH